jgi:hypothetical protein
MHLPRLVCIITLSALPLGGALLPSCSSTSEAICLPEGRCECVAPADCGQAPPCQAYACLGTCKIYPIAKGKPCAAGVCDGTGDCVACVDDDDCADGHCDDATCYSCDDGEKNGREEGVDCGGPCKACLGKHCLLGTECQSGICSDNLCCTAHCAQVCTECGPDGMCRNIEQLQFDDNECGFLDGHACNGQGQCALANGEPCVENDDCASFMCKGNPPTCKTF